MIKNYLLILFCLLNFSKVAWCQEDFQFGLTMFNPFAINPAYAGSKLALSANFQTRSQWKTLVEPISTNSFVIHSPTKSKKVSLGAKFIDDKAAYTLSQTLAFYYAYRTKLKNGNLALGLSLGVKNKVVNWVKVKLRDVEQNVNFISTPLSYQSLYSDFGIYYNNENGYVGFSATNLFGSPQMSGDKVLKNKVHYYIQGGKSYRVSSTVLINPAIQLRVQPGSPVGSDLYLNFSFADRLWTGIYLNNSHTIGALIQYQFKRGLKLGYARETFYPGNGIAGLNTHELVLGWDLSIFNTKSLSFRYL